MTDSFIHEIQLKTTPQNEAVLDVRMDAARQLYNACLGETLRRLDLMRESKDFRMARNMPKGKVKSTTFRDSAKAQHFNEYSLHAFAAETKNALPLIPLQKASAAKICTEPKALMLYSMSLISDAQSCLFTVKPRLF